jgi:ankyrin repeat protein
MSFCNLYPGRSQRSDWYEEVAQLIINRCNSVLENVFVFCPSAITKKQWYKLVSLAAKIKNKPAIQILVKDARVSREPSFAEINHVIEHSCNNTLQLMLDSFPNLAVSTGSDGESLLHRAAYLGRLTALDTLKKHIDVDVQDNWGQTPLHYAARGLYAKQNSKPSDTRRYSKIVDLLVQKGADIDAEDHQGVTPLFVAIDANSEAVVYGLLKYDADMSIIPQHITGSLITYAENNKKSEAVIESLKQAQEKQTALVLEGKKKELESIRAQLGDNQFKQLFELDLQAIESEEMADEFSDLRRELTKILEEEN